MSTCFIFAEGSTEEGCFSLCLGADHEVTEAFAHRPYGAVQLLQRNHQTILVLPTQRFNLYQVPLPQKVNEKTARAAIPFALEEQLAQNISAFHFAFDRSFYKEGEYLVIVGDKNYLNQLCSLLKSHTIQWDSMTMDWFALAEEEVAVTDQAILVNDVALKGVLDEDVASFYWEKAVLSPSKRKVYHFTNSDAALWKRCKAAAKNAADAQKNFSLQEPKEVNASEFLEKCLPAADNPCYEVETLNKDSYVWIAQQLSKKAFIDFCQGEFEVGTASVRLKRWYQLAGGLALLWLITFLARETQELHHLKQEIVRIDNKIAVIYREFFPQATQVISPKFRINQLLKSNQNQATDHYWQLLDGLARHWDISEMELEQMRFQNQTLILSLITKDFESLESLYQGLRKEGIKVQQKQATTDHGKVQGTVELR